MTNDVFMYLGQAIAFTAGVLDIGHFRIGGGVTRQSDIVMPVIRKWVDYFAYPIAGRTLSVEKAVSSPYSSIYGAEVNGKVKLLSEAGK